MTLVKDSKVIKFFSSYSYFCTNDLQGTRKILVVNVQGGLEKQQFPILWNNQEEYVKKWLYVGILYKEYTANL